MSSQESTSRSVFVPRSVLLPLSAISVLLALAAFGVAAAFQSRTGTDDPLAAVAAALTGSILLIAGIAGIQAARRKDNTGEKKTASTRFSNGVIRVISILLGSVAVLGGIDFLCMSFVVLNQEYLHYFEFSTSYHSGNSSQAALLAEFSILGFGFTAIGVFLVWYAVHPLSRFKAAIRVRAEPRAQAESSDPIQGQCDGQRQENN